MSENKITGVLLAGGKNSRMGHDKGLLVVDGKVFSEQIIDELKHVTSEIIIISNGSNYNCFGYKVYSDIIKNCGPMGGIFTALTLSQTERIIVIACDMPFIKSCALHKLIESSYESEITVPEIGGEPQPLCGVYSVSCINRFSILLKENKWKMKNALASFRTKRINFSENYFSNINTPEEYNIINTKNYDYSN